MSPTGFFADECTISGGILDDDCEREVYLPRSNDLLLHLECSFPLLIALCTSKDTRHRPLEPRKDSFNVGDKAFTCSPRLDHETKFRYLDRSCHAPHHLYGEIFEIFYPHCPLDWFSLFRDDGVDVPVATGIAGYRDEQEIRKVRDLKVVMDDLYLTSARRAGSRIYLPHLLPTTDLLARDLDGHRSYDDIFLLTKPDYVSVHIFCNVTKVF